MTGVVGQAVRRLLRLPVLTIALLCGLTLWFADMAGTYRPAHWLLALTMLAGGILLALDALILTRRVASARPSEVSGHVIEVALRYAPLVVLNLILLNVLAPALGFAAALMDGVSWIKTWLTLLGWLSGRALFWLFAIAVAGLGAVVAMRLAERVARRSPLVARAASIADRGIIALTAIYCAWAMVLTFNGTFDRTPGSERRGEITAVWGIAGTPLWWADLQSADHPGGLVRVLVFPERDRVAPALLSPGQRVRVHVRGGLFGLAWVERMRLDFEHALEPLVASAPSAAIPRRHLVETLLRGGRWTEAAEHARAYARYHPGDREFVSRVSAALREARQGEPAAQLDRAVGAPLARAQGPR